MELAGLEPATLLGAMTRSRCSLGQIQLVQALSAHVTSERACTSYKASWRPNEQESACRSRSGNRVFNARRTPRAHIWMALPLGLRRSVCVMSVNMNRA